MEWSRFLVTGAGGFVGSCLTRRLLAPGTQVFLLLRRETNLWRLRDILPRVQVLNADLVDRASVRAAVAEARPDAVFHFAAHGSNSSQQDVTRILETDVMGTWNLLEPCLESACRLFVHAGSSSEYGYKSEPMRETDRLEPNSYYAVAKAAATHLLSYVAHRARFGTATLRLFSVYGPWEEPTRLIPTLLRRLSRHEPIDMVPREIARDFVYVDDVVEACLRLDRLAALRGEVVNVGSGVQSTMEDVVRAAVEITGSKSEIRWGSMAPRIWDTTRWVGSVEKAERILGWRSSHGIREGLAKTLEWIRSREGAA